MMGLLDSFKLPSLDDIVKGIQQGVQNLTSLVAGANPIGELGELLTGTSPFQASKPNITTPVILPTPTPTPTPQQPTGQNAVIYGHVYLDGKPISNAEVRADVFASGIISGWWTANTDNTGAYTLKVVCPQNNLLYSVKASYDTYSQTKTVLLSPASTQTLDFYLSSTYTPPTPPTPSTKGIIKGKVVDYYSKAPVEGASVTAVEQISLATYNTTTKSDGTFSLEVEDKKMYNVTVSKAGSNAWSGWANVNGTFDFGEIPLVLSEKPIGEYSAVVYGTVRFPDGKVASGVKVSVDVSVFANIVSYPTTTDSNGNYSIKVSWSVGAVSPTFTLKAEYPNYYYEKNISLNAGDNIRVDITLEKGEKPLIPTDVTKVLTIAAIIVGGLVVYKAVK